MNGASLLVLAVVILILGVAVYNVYRMVKRRSCCGCGKCGCSGQINCTIKDEEEK